MDKKLEKLEQKRQQLLQTFLKHSRIGIIFLVIAVVLFVASLVGGDLIPALLIIAIIIFIVGIVFFAKAQSEASKYRDVIKNDLIHSLLENEFSDVSYSPAGTIALDRINGTGTVRKPDRFYGEDYIKGVYKGVQFEVSDVDLKERIETRDKNGNVVVTYETYFKGRWYIYQYPKRFDEILKIVEGRSSYVNRRNLEKFETESIAFNKKFNIFSSSQQFGFYLITSLMIEKLLHLESMHRGTILYCFQNNELHIGINDRKDYMELGIKTPLNEAALKNFMADIDIIPAIINEFSLNGPKFK